jgi:hypothetical protein
MKSLPVGKDWFPSHRQQALNSVTVPAAKPESGSGILLMREETGFLGARRPEFLFSQPKKTGFWYGITVPAAKPVSHQFLPISNLKSQIALTFRRVI